MEKETTKKVRMTNQRRVVLEELKKLKSHPTADELYQIIRKRLPKISLGTVYRNLDLLFKTGVIGRLDVGNGQYRFDANVEKHYHIRCVHCGHVHDVFYLPEIEIEKEISKLTNYKLTGYKLEFFGICPKCKKLSR
jgi:Fur family ferric uptake transcriptional regulator